MRQYYFVQFIIVEIIHSYTCFYRNIWYFLVLRCCRFVFVILNTVINISADINIFLRLDTE